MMKKFVGGALALGIASTLTAVHWPFVGQAGSSDHIPKDALLRHWGADIHERSENIHPQGIVGQSAAEAAALAREAPGSAVIKSELADVSNVPYPGQQCLCWIVSVNPKGGHFAEGPGHQRFNYDDFFVDAHTGLWVRTLSGTDTGEPDFEPL